MVKLVWTEIAISDLNDIFDFIAVDSKRYASITVNKVYNRAQNIKGNPLAGWIVPEFNDRMIREVISGSYRIVYKIMSKFQVVILRVYYTSRLLTEDKLK